MDPPGHWVHVLATASATAVPGLCVEVVFWYRAVRYAPVCAALCDAVLCTL